MTIRLRPAGIADLDQLFMLMKQLQADDPWSCDFDEPLVRAVTGKLLQDPSVGRAWFICDDERAIGYVVLAFDFSLEYRGKGGWIDEFFVLPGYRGKGIGAQAMNFVEQAARDLGVQVMHLEVNHGNPAIELYRRQGYRDHQRYLMSKWLQEK